MQAGLNHNNPPEPQEQRLNHNQRRIFSYNQKDECWNNVILCLKTSIIL